MKEKLECILEITKNIPRALIEATLFASMPLGIATAIIGTGTAYLFGQPELAKLLAIGGGTAAIGGFAGSGIYGILTAHGAEFGGLEVGDLAIDNIINAVKDYKNIRG